MQCVQGCLIPFLGCCVLTTNWREDNGQCRDLRGYSPAALHTLCVVFFICRVLLYTWSKEMYLGTYYFCVRTLCSDPEQRRFAHCSRIPETFSHRKQEN